MSTRADIIEAVKIVRDNAADNLHRAGAAFRHFSPAQMEEQHGESGKSRSEILAGYRTQLDRWNAAMEKAQAIQ